jgi:hypothetical protein
MPHTADSNPHPALAFTQHWLRMWEHTAALAGGSLEGVARFCDPRQLRNLWLAELGRATDRYLRSPAFLQLMQYNLRALTDVARLSSPFRFR